MALKLKSKLKKTPSKLKAEPIEIPQPSGNLREIMDNTQVFNMIYSGVENDTYFDILYDLGIRSFLMSYHYVQNKHLNMAKRFEDIDVRLFIDSGAHTYQNDPKYKDFGCDYWEKHLQGYLRWVEKNQKYIFAVASFDYENLVGPEKVKEWNTKYLEPFMLRTKIPVCFVWHQNSLDSWEYYCKRYPYVGFSSVNTEGVAIDLDEYISKLKVAEKHESLVHGFGMTRTAMLTQLPFYTSDSTTWLVGLQYGEVNYWNGTKMSRLKKVAWKGEYLSRICEKYHLDEELMKEEDSTELVKANVGAFQEAETYIQTKLRSHMYWLKAKSVKVDINDLPNDFFPTFEWFTETDCDNFKDYTSKMNINGECENSLDILYDMTAFMNWHKPEYEVMHENYLKDNSETLIGLHDMFINRIVANDDERINDLIKFYSECLAGNDDKLLQIGTNFDRVLKERESYIQDDADELVDITPEQVREKIKYLLPTSKDSEEEGAPEIDCLDAEIYKRAEIVPTFDEKGKFVKGQVAVRKPKKVYSKKYPKFACDTCYAGTKCPEYKAGFVCAYSDMFNRFDTRDMADIIQATQGIVEHNMTRMQRAMLMEVMNGTVDPVVTTLMNQNIQYMNMLRQMYDNGSAEVLKQTKIVRADGTMEETTSITNPQSGGILEKMFGSMSKSEPSPSDEIIEGTVTEKNKRYDKLDE